MGCNCGDNEYNITVNNNGNCEPTTPVYNITLANVGVNGYSPIVRFVNETVESFNIAVDNVTGTETSPAVPKLSYVADQINNVNTTIANLGNTYLTKDGSNAANPISINGLTIREQYGNLYINTNTQVSFSSNANPISIGGSSINLTSIGTGQVGLLPSYGVILNSAENKNIRLTTSGTGIATYNNKEIATVNQLPTVGNGTITITQGGITKGTFTTNQSGNSTIELDAAGETYLAGEGISIRDNYIWLDYNLNRGLEVPVFSNSLAIKTDSSAISFDSNGALTIAPSLLAQYVTNTSLATTLADYALSADIPTVGNGTITINQSGTQKGTFTLNQSGDVTIDLDTGGSSYTAGTGIDITNDTISVDDTILTTDTVQTVTEAKTFNADIHLNGGDIKLDSTTSYIQGKASGNTYRNIIARSIGGSEITIGNQSDILKLAGSLPHPKYNNVDMALLTDVPTVYNSTITFTQGGVTKGTITLNQSSNATIALDAGGSGGGAVDSVNGQTGTVVLTASDVGALPSSTVIPTKTSDLTNDSGYITSSALSDYVNKTTDQTVTGVITFSNGIQTYEINNPDGDNLLSNLNNNTSVGDINSTINLYGNTTRPKYYDNQYNTPVDLALSSDIPTVNNPTITFTQGGTTKGTITLNQSSNQTIALDAGGGGGVTIDDTTPSTTTVYSSQKTQDLIDAKQNTLTAGSNIQINGDTISATNTTYSAMTVSEGTTGTATTARTMRADRLKSIIQGTKLTGLDTSDNSAVEATDDILTGIGKLQAEVNNTISADAVNYLLNDKEDVFDIQSPLTMTYTLNGVGTLDTTVTMNSDGTTTTGNVENYYGFWCDGFGTSLPQTNYWRFNFRIKRVNASASNQPFFALADGVGDYDTNFIELYFNDYNFPTNTWVQCSVIHQAGASTVQFEYTVNDATTTVQNVLASGYILASNKYVKWMGVGITVIADLSWNTNYQLEPYGVRHVFTDRNLGVDNTAFDGQWVAANSGNIISGSNITWTNGHNYDLSSYLPNDGHIYEVIFQASWTGSTAGSNHSLRASTDIITSSWNWLGRAFGTDIAAGTCILPVGTGRYIKLITEAKGCNAVYFSALGYRRLGTNS